MQVGVFGDVVFQVSRDRIMTPNGVTLQTSAKWKEHDRHLSDPLPEFAGSQGDKINMTITLTTAAGVDPQKEIDKLLKMERSGEAHFLIIGNKSFGKWQWVIQKVNIAYERIAGVVISAKATLTLLAYPRR